MVMKLFIPRGFAHGFLVLSDEAIFTYKVDNVCAPPRPANFLYFYVASFRTLLFAGTKLWFAGVKLSFAGTK